MESDAGVEADAPARGRRRGGERFADAVPERPAGRRGTAPGLHRDDGAGRGVSRGLAVGYWKDTADIRQNRQTGRVFLPEMRDATRAKLLKGWNRALTTALAWADMEE